MCGECKAKNEYAQACATNLQDMQKKWAKEAKLMKNGATLMTAGTQAVNQDDSSSEEEIDSNVVRAHVPPQS